MLALHLRSGRVVFTAIALFTSIAISACVSGSAPSLATLHPAEFAEQSERICTGHREDLDELIDSSHLVSAEKGAELEPEVERMRRRMLVLRLDVLAELRLIQPEGSEAEWHRAIEAHAAAIERAGRGDRVDVQDQELADSVERLVEGFALSECF